ncbi:hypothetical protein [Sphingobacterium sp.]|uniref:hypothetical protein n=1 Tax=Sphingobacterium sp. TaxID=341027 RepID=UPI0028B1A158|nr:hypothetical protein [Sphingobacterium sp.]
MLIHVHDSMQKDYSYELTEPMGKNFDQEFQPQLSPQEMLELGVFNGKYLNDCRSEFPKEWFEYAKLYKGKNKVGDPSLNFFKVKASQPLSEWQRKGWIHPQDPRGWFQWYCRYFMGRRSEDDERQIKRWKAFKRHIAQVKGNCAFGDFKCRPKQRQALLHWAYDSINL